MRAAYSDAMVPPGLLLRVRVSPVSGGARREVDAVVDTGASVSVIPDDLQEELGLFPRGSVEGRGAVSREFREYPTYYVSLGIEGWEPFDLPVVALPRENVLIGRDVLNRIILHADGPARFFELTR